MHENLKKAVEVYDQCSGKVEDCDTCPLRLRDALYGIPLCEMLEAVNTQFKEA